MSRCRIIRIILLVDSMTPGTGPYNFSIFGNMFDWTVCVTTDTAEEYYALDADDYSLIKSISFPRKSNSIPGLRFTSSQDKYVKPRF